MVKYPKFSVTEEVDVGAIRGGQTDTNDNEVTTYNILVYYYGRRAFTTLVPAVGYLFKVPTTFLMYFLLM